MPVERPGLPNLHQVNERYCRGAQPKAAGMPELVKLGVRTVTRRASLRGARALAEAGIVPGGSKRNARHFGKFVSFADAVDPATRMLLADAQTSGGLLMCVAPERAAALGAALEERGVLHAVIGQLEEGPAGAIRCA